MKKEAHPKKLRDGYGYKFDINTDWRLFSEDMSVWLIIDHLEYLVSDVRQKLRRT
ncbi:hypothetical protein [Escherichia coli]|uniref:ParE family toxin-like protein n=1 Tax=Escherichia coli TaxID=562 RepID=UPI003AFA8951